MCVDALDQPIVDTLQHYNLEYLEAAAAAARMRQARRSRILVSASVVLLFLCAHATVQNAVGGGSVLHYTPDSAAQAEQAALLQVV